MASNKGKKNAKVEEKLGETSGTANETSGTNETAGAEGGEAKKDAAPKSRGPRGVAEDAKIAINQEGNPKRPGSRAYKLWDMLVAGNVEGGQTVGSFCNALEAAGHGKEATPELVYNAKHGFITIAGYEVPGGVTPVKAKAPKAPKAEKAPKGSQVSAEAKEQVEQETQTETVE
jgi:hypothetical protein